MDVERTMQFILDQQAKQEAKQEAWHETHQIEMAAIRQTLVETTKVQLEQARLLVQIEEGHKKLDSAHQATERALKELAGAHQATEQALKELAAAQQVTEQKLQTFIDNLGRSTNGH